MSEASTEGFDRGSPLLERELPRSSVIAIGCFVVALVLSALGVAFGLALPETVDARFVLLPNIGTDPVTIPFGGTVEEVLVAKGDQIEAGAPLFRIRSDRLGVPAERVTRLEREITAKRALVDTIEPRYQAQARVAEARIEGLAAELVHARKRVQSAKRLAQMTSTSFDQGLVSRAELLRDQQTAATVAQDHERLVRERAEKQADLGRLEADQSGELAAHSLELTRLQGELEEARAVVAGLDRSASERGNTYLVRAPYEGTVIEIGPEREGVIIERGDVVCQIAREDALLVAELAVPELGAAELRPGTRARLLLDAFPYGRFGGREATITWVSPTAEGGAIRIQADIEDPTMVVNGRRQPLRAGMQGVAKLHTGERTLVEFALEPLRQLQENIGD